MTENKFIKDLEERLSKSADKKNTLIEAATMMKLSYFADVIAMGGDLPKEEAEYCIYLCSCLELSCMPDVAKAIAVEFNGKTYLRNRVTFDLPEAPGLQTEIMSRVGKKSLLEVQATNFPRDESSEKEKMMFAERNDLMVRELMIDGKYFGSITGHKDETGEIIRIAYIGFIPDLTPSGYIFEEQKAHQKIAHDMISVVAAARSPDPYKGIIDEAVLLKASKITKEAPIGRDDVFTRGSLALKFL